MVEVSEESTGTRSSWNPHFVIKFQAVIVVFTRCVADRITRKGVRSVNI